ncbi:hypothetical protein IB286_10905 [Spongiibacter sp. KMU-158]|uniref:Uncharacterized protein n=1 Tax=Spongiibacter pelagi TaxID=2760804 RepID=A0A927C1G2_9GAMM|nr:hypothetical protein [Spongiibacter pelagi]MBD2859513.1 hypothetical protein [Spongiibacter pelagi]
MKKFTGYFFRSICVICIVCIAACSVTKTYSSSDDLSEPLKVGETYQVRFLDGLSEKAKIVELEESGFADAAGHFHLFSELEGVDEKKFSFLKTTGLATGVLVVLVGVGIILISGFLEDLDKESRNSQ